MTGNLREIFLPLFQRGSTTEIVIATIWLNRAMEKGSRKIKVSVTAGTTGKRSPRRAVEAVTETFLHETAGRE
jgi:hypothetical protein